MIQHIFHILYKHSHSFLGVVVPLRISNKYNSNKKYVVSSRLTARMSMAFFHYRFIFAVATPDRAQNKSKEYKSAI